MKIDSRVLIVDDEISIRKLLRMNLLNAEYVVSEASTGAEALEKASTFDNSRFRIAGYGRLRST